jgi:hypothetical protein
MAAPAVMTQIEFTLVAIRSAALDADARTPVGVSLDQTGMRFVLRDVPASHATCEPVAGSVILAGSRSSALHSHTVYD